MASANITVAYVARGASRPLSAALQSARSRLARGPSAGMQVNTPTRPHLSDLVYRNRKEIRRTGSPIENAMLHCVLAYFCFLDRTRARLADGIAKQLPPDVFGARGPALLCVTSRRCAASTACFAVNASASKLCRSRIRRRSASCSRDYLWLDGPIGTMIWGPDAVATLLFSHILRWHRPQLLDGIGLSIVAFDGTDSRQLRLVRLPRPAHGHRGARSCHHGRSPVRDA